MQPIAKLLQILHRELLHLVRGVSRFEVRSQRPTLDGLGQDDGGLTLDLRGGLVCGIHLAVVVPATLQGPDLVIAPGLHEFRGSRIASEEVISNEGSVLGLVGLEIAVVGVVHQIDQRTITVRR